MAVIFSLFILFLFGIQIYFIGQHTHPPDGRELVIASVYDGINVDDNHGCFFLLRAGASMNISARNYTFFVAEKGKSWVKLDLDYRYYDRNQTPYGGDQNRTYSSTFPEEDPYWQVMEYIGFDMPTEDMGIEIVDRNIYEVMIKNQRGQVTYIDSFIYTCQGNVTYM